uniref:hypothetical protein n=1 Tax=Nocardioides sp. TaxID=35761 RepID=UPI003568A1A3
MFVSTKSLVAVSALALSLSATPLVPGPAQAQIGVQSGVAAVASPSLGQAAKTRQPRREGYRMRITTFNILSSAHRSGGLDRARRAARWVQKQGAVAAAFQEVAKDQLRQLQRTMPGYSFYPRRTLGTRGSAIQIGWKNSEVKLIKTGYVMRPFLRHQRPIPWVRLKDRETGRNFLVMAIHNSPGGHEAERDISTRKEIAQIKKMLNTGYPVFVVGDVNERSEFCEKVARATPLISMNGGTRKNPCPVPRYGGPDWMLGGGAGAAFKGFKKDYNGISDHPALTAHVRVP